jgi:hypothetical protein
MIPLAPLEAAHVVVSDRDLDERHREMLRFRGVEVVVA